ncbi:hypothetical protein VKT23_014928 [Stygiomarasmius scandens]|uniref:Uncharacterized protein n=1 Tax=Marasmiellus scandens TaxID=2682957 RepID=A0ABR1J235_9AGAR
MPKQQFDKLLENPIRESEKFWVIHAQWLEQHHKKLRYVPTPLEPPEPQKLLE